MNKPVIKLEGVTKTVGDKQILFDVSFEIEKQSLVSLIGPNGAGKSTLVKIILGLDKNFEGKVQIDKNEKIHYIPQLSSNDQYQLPLSVYEYISIGTTPLYSGTTKDIDLDKTLEHVGVDKQKIYQAYQSLSGGERQRVAIARALLGNPTMLILDEPLAAVDFPSRAGLYELIRHLQKDHKMTVLLVSHDTDSVLPLSDRVLCLNQTLHTDCHPSSLINDNGDYQPVVHHHC